MFDAIWSDARHALRTLRRSPKFASIAVLTLAFGIGANTAIFSVVNGILLKPLPYSDSEELVGVWHTAPGLNITNLGMAPSLVPTAFAMDLRVLGFAVLSSVTASILFGLVPAIRGTRSGSVSVTRAHGTAVSDQSAMTPMRLVITFQVALSFVLVMAAALLARSLINLSQLDPGFDREHLVVAWVNLSVSGFTQEQLPALYARLVQRVESTPGVRSASLSACGLGSNCRSLSDVTIEGYDPAPGESVQFLENRVTPGYFTTVGIELLQGRQFGDRDTADTRQVAVVDEAAVRRYFGGRSPLGKRFGHQALDFEIVGVVSDARTLNLTEESAPIAYYPLAQPVVFARSIDVRAAGDPEALSRSVQGVLAAVEPNLVVERVTTMDAQLEENIAQQQLVAYVTTAFGLLAVLLASIGLYGVMSYAVVRRAADVGVRMAIGARPIDVTGLILADGMRLVIAGIVIGFIVALAAGRLIETIVFGVSPFDPVTYVAVVATLIAVAFTACYVPSRRAALVDPMTALRAE
jgi:putative ABC transport system permease protein